MQNVILKDYTKGEERFNWITHLVGAILAIVCFVVALVFAIKNGSPWVIVGSIVFSIMLIIMYSASTIYHMLPLGKAKKVFRVIDHCVIFLLIAGSYTPFSLVTLRELVPWVGWTILGVIWGAAILGIVLNTIDLKKFAKMSLGCYIAMGWCAILTIHLLLQGIGLTGFLLLLAGGVFYTIGAVLYALGRKKRYIHSVWHIFVILGSTFHFFTILFFVII